MDVSKPWTTAQERSQKEKERRKERVLKATTMRENRM